MTEQKGDIAGLLDREQSQFSHSTLFGDAAAEIRRLRESLRRAEVILSGARALHREIPIYPGDCEDESGEHAFDPAEEFCRDCPPEMHACETCRDEDGSWIEWPCETATALDPNAWLDDLVREAASVTTTEEPDRD